MLSILFKVHEVPVFHHTSLKASTNVPADEDALKPLITPQSLRSPLLSSNVSMSANSSCNREILNTEGKHIFSGYLIQ